MRQSRQRRGVKQCDKVIVDFGLLCPVLAYALRLMNNNPFHKLIEDKRGKFLNIGMLFYCPKKSSRTVLMLFLRINLRL